MTDHMDIDGRIPIPSNSIPILSNLPKPFEKIQQSGEVLRRNFNLQQHVSVAVPTIDDPAIDLNETRFDLPDSRTGIIDLNRQADDRSRPDLRRSRCRRDRDRHRLFLPCAQGSDIAHPFLPFLRRLRFDRTARFPLLGPDLRLTR